MVYRSIWRKCSLLTSLEKIGCILYTRIWNRKTQIKMYCRINQAIINGRRNACYQGITFTVSFCKDSHTFAKIGEFVMKHPSRNAFSSRLPHLCTIENIVRHNVGINMGLLDHYLGRTLLELIINCHYCRTPSTLTNHCWSFFSGVVRLVKRDDIFCRIKNRFYSILLSNYF